MSIISYDTYDINESIRIDMYAFSQTYTLFTLYEKKELQIYTN